MLFQVNQLLLIQRIKPKQRTDSITTEASTAPDARTPWPANGPLTLLALSYSVTAWEAETLMNSFGPA